MTHIPPKAARKITALSLIMLMRCLCLAAHDVPGEGAAAVAAASSNTIAGARLGGPDRAPMAPRTEAGRAPRFGAAFGGSREPSC